MTYLLSASKSEFKKNIQKWCESGTLSGSGSNGKIYKVCDGTECYAVKVGYITEEEFNIAKLVMNVSSRSNYENHFFKVYRYDELTKLKSEVMQYLSPFQCNGKKIIDLSNYFNYCSAKEMALATVQIFTILEFLRKNIKGFLHRDLKPENIATTPNTKKHEFLVKQTSNEKVIINVPENFPNLVLIDFGLSTCDAFRNEGIFEGIPFNGHCKFESFDIARWIVTIKQYCTTKEHLKFLQGFSSSLFGNELENIIKRGPDYFDVGFQMIVNKGCQIVKHVTYGNAAASALGASNISHKTVMLEDEE